MFDLVCGVWQDIQSYRNSLSPGYSMDDKMIEENGWVFLEENVTSNMVACTQYV